jgi:hypothetical protein
MTRDEVAKKLGFIGANDTRLLDPQRCSHAWTNLETGKREIPIVERGKGGGPWGCVNCARFLRAIPAGQAT